MEVEIEPVIDTGRLKLNMFDELQTMNIKTPSYIPKKSYCDNLSKTAEDFNILINNHYQQRTDALKSLDNLLKYDDNYHYPNLDFITNFNKYFYVDDPCLCNLQTGVSTDNITIEKKFGQGKAGIANKINIKGKDYIVKSIANIKKPEYISLRVRRYNQMYSKHINANPCIEYNKHLFTEDHKNTFEGLLIAECDNFANQTCIHMILNEIFKNNINNIKNFIYQYDAFYCTTKEYGIMFREYTIENGLNIMELADHKDLSSYIDQNDTIIDNDTVIDMFEQILLPLIYLKCKKYGFVHADLKCRNIFVAKDETGKPIYKLADFDKSSIFWKGIRFCTPITGVDYANYYGYDVKKTTNGIEYYSLGGMTSKYVGEQLYTMFHWLPMHMSYDIYTFIYSLIREPKIYNSLNELPIIEKILRYMFFDDDYTTIMDDLKQKMNEYNTILVSKDADKIKKYLIKLGGLGEMNKDLIRLNIKLKIDINSIYSEFDLKNPEMIDEEIDKYHEKNPRIIHPMQISTGKMTREYHVCTSKCVKGECNTNRYYQTVPKMKIYEQDYCIEK